ncbi:MAG TPA: UDP-N-acetylmuramate:L-alanyl-gamma-D-glutamyl-meso-diaminopimelate ligase [Candidatus Binatia bacterium]|jgi:UDP-N-acetylmuramate: L-alanyl-gamma-D-glutamyl-meso-diaminopimelate ligase|nr:UDP-N-acetylmuramate:L-alanyl-gamma-D-glutamyl-meso-diaminopimelate ligase [Candidatus Binatia bacterium]
MNNLPPPGSRVHLIAVCGVGMASLAGLLSSLGYRVTGSDHNVYPPMSTYLEKIGIPILSGYHEQHLQPRPDLVVIGNAVSRSNPEASAVLDQGIPYISFPQALGQFLIGCRTSLVVTGTHGKTTTSALAAWVLTRAGLEPGFFIGGVPLNFGSGWHPGSGNYVVLEGDEYDSAFFDKGPKFLHYRPHHAILTSVEFDHADIYRDLDHLKDAFRRFVELIPTSGCLVACHDYLAVKEVVAAARCRLVYYGNEDAADWTVKSVEIREGRSLFEPFYRGRSDGFIEVPLIGRHNVQNALAVYAMARELGIDRQKLRDGLATFAGIKRRQEIKGRVRGVLVMDDFAHHPTAVKETLSAVREAYPGRRVWAIFEPRSNTSRRNIFEREFAHTLALADRIVVAGLYQPEKVPEPERLSTQKIVDTVNGAGLQRAVVIEKADAIASYVGNNTVAGDIVIVMSNGGFDGVQDKILQALAG